MQIHPTGLIISFLQSFLPAILCGLGRLQLEIITAFINFFFFSLGTSLGRLYFSLQLRR